MTESRQTLSKGEEYIFLLGVNTCANCGRVKSLPMTAE